MSIILSRFDLYFCRFRLVWASFWVVFSCFGFFWISLRLVLRRFFHFDLVWVSFGVFWLVLGQFRYRFGSFWLVWCCFGSFCVNLDHFRLFWLILARFGLFWMGRFSSFWVVLARFVSSWLVFGQFRSPFGFWLVLGVLTKVKNDLKQAKMT